MPPRFRLAFSDQAPNDSDYAVGLETLRPDRTRKWFHFTPNDRYWESIEIIPEPHEFKVSLQLGAVKHEVTFEEHSHDHAAQGVNNIRSAYIHVMADAAMSVLAITGLVLARSFGWLWMDPVAGIIGALVIANWSFGLLRDTGRILLDMNPDERMANQIRKTIEFDGDRLVDLHLWRLGPGHLGGGGVVSVVTSNSRDCEFYRARLKGFKSLSHVTVEIKRNTA